PRGQAPRSLAFHPQDGRLAAACGTCIRLFDVGTGKELPALRDDKIQSWSFGLAWQPNGHVLAATSEDRKIHLWNTQTATEAVAPLTGHSGSGIRMAFNHKGDRLISTSWGGDPRLWDIVSRRPLLTLPAKHGLQFSPDDSLIGLGRNGTKLQLWRVADGRELRLLRQAKAENLEPLYSPVVDATGRVLAAAASERMSFFDLETGRELASIQFRQGTTAYPHAFHQRSGWMTCGNSGIVHWPTQPDPTANVLRIGPPRWLASASEGADVSGDGRITAIPQGKQTLVLDRDRPGRRI